MGKVLIVEDEENIRSGIVKIVKNINANLDVYETGAAKSAFFIAGENKIDIFILDIQLEDYSGLELAMQLREIDTYKVTPIIFISGAISKEFEAYRQIHCYAFIEKPFAIKDIREVLENIIVYGIKKEEPLKLILKNKEATYIIKETDIIYIERRNRKLSIKTTNQVIDYSFDSLTRICEQLSNDFVQCHQGFVINKTFIRKIDHVENVLYLDKIEYAIPIGRKYRKTLNNKIIIL